MTLDTSPRLLLPSPLEHQVPIGVHLARFKQLVCGRRFGKTTLGEIISIEGHGPPACHRGALEGGRIWWVQPSYPMATEVWRMLNQSAMELLEAGIAQRSRMEYRIDFPAMGALRQHGGGSVSIKSADNPDSLRGVGLDGVVLDEAAMMREEVWYEAIRPTLSDRLGWAVFLSTPKGHNWFRNLYLAAQGNQNWMTWRLPTAANLLIPAEEIEQARTEMPELSFRQEFLAEFVEGLGAVFTNILPVCSLPVIREQHAEGYDLWIGSDPIENRRYILGLDIGRMNDSTVLSVFDPYANQQVALLRMTGQPWPYQRMKLEDLGHRYPGHTFADATSLGMIAVDDLSQVLPFVTPVVMTHQIKTEIVTVLRMGFEAERFMLMNVRDQIREFEAFEGTPLPAGGIRYEASPGLHDDMVVAAGLAAANLGRRVASFPTIVTVGESNDWSQRWHRAVHDSYGQTIDLGRESYTMERTQDHDERRSVLEDW